MRFFILCFSLLLIMPAYAQDEMAEKELQEILDETAQEKQKERADQFIYAPESCDFEITFPSEPLTAKRCPRGPRDQCFDVSSYTMVYELATTLDVSVTCIKSSPTAYKKYSEPVIRTALEGMIDGADIEEFRINTQEIEDVRQGSLIGSGAYNNQSRIYNAQLWVGQNSILTLEAKLIGVKSDQADAEFTQILKSLRKKD